MNSGGSALKVALELAHLPSQVHHARSAPLPSGMRILLEVATGDEMALASAAELTGRPRGVIQQAARFYIEQVLFAPDADSYRVLGATRDASAKDLWCNMGLLMRWLHPDRANGCEMSIFAGRVTRAWDDVKTPERRLSYDKNKFASESVRQRKPKSRGRGNRSERSGRPQAMSGGQALTACRQHDPIRGERESLIRRALAYLLSRGK